MTVFPSMPYSTTLSLYYALALALSYNVHCILGIRSLAPKDKKTRILLGSSAAAVGGCFEGLCRHHRDGPGRGNEVARCQICMVPPDLTWEKYCSLIKTYISHTFVYSDSERGLGSGFRPEGRDDDEEV